MAGDGLWMAGRVGLAAAGLRALERGDHENPSLAEAVAKWRRPSALMREGKAMAGLAHAAIDVSDGLARDAGHLGKASSVQIVFDGPALLADEGLARAAEALGEEPLNLALYGGEDYALVAASPTAIVGFRRIGELRKGEGVILRTAAGERRIEERGFDHFAAK
jgi:thiamine-monophosphate kinase